MRASETTDPGESGPGLGAGGSPSGPEPSGDRDPLSQDTETRFFVTLRFARIQLRGTFTTRDASLRPADWVLARTVRGTEQAQVLSRPRTVPPPPGSNDPEEAEVVGEVLGSLAPEEVLAPWGRTERFTPEFEAAAGMIAQMGLPMRLTDVETLPRQDKAIFYFLADGRVDFRQLVRNLARTLRLRVEMKQIGVRDEARLKGTCGHCGLDLCCARWIRRMTPVNMKMAKTQKTTLDPDKISGRCGRLLCCLRYEEQVYVDHRNRLPCRNTPVRTPAGPGRVVGQELLRCQVRVVLDGGEVKTFPLEEIERLSGADAPMDPEFVRQEDPPILAAPDLPGPLAGAGQAAGESCGFALADFGAPDPLGSPDPSLTDEEEEPTGSGEGSPGQASPGAEKRRKKRRRRRKGGPPATGH